MARGYAPRFVAPSVNEKLALAPRLSIVVLPFENLGGDPEQEFFADGITDDLTTDLSHLPDSFVIARNTAFTYKGKSVDAKQIGLELGVRYLLEGSVRRIGDKVAVNAQLIFDRHGSACMGRPVRGRPTDARQVAGRIGRRACDIARVGACQGREPSRDARATGKSGRGRSRDARRDDIEFKAKHGKFERRRWVV
jgi:TolB-like protein